jgi:HIND motif
VVEVKSRLDIGYHPTVHRTMASSLNSSNGIKAMVTDENGEISCSVDETNRIRALLGLRPLNNEKGSNEKEAVQNFNENRERLRK